MRHRDFHQACCEFNWGWRASEDPEVFTKGAIREHELRAIASETKALREILIKAEAKYWQREIAKVKEVYP